MNLKDYYWYFDSVLPHKFCDELIKYGNTKKEELVFKAVQFTKVRTETGLAKKPVGVAVDMYVNPETGTYTIIEFHPTYKSYCVISYGTKFQVFLGGVQ